MLVMGSGYTTATPVINQVPNIFGFSETKVDNSAGIDTEEDERVTGRVALLSQEDFESDDIYLYYVDEGQNLRISTSSFGMPVGYRTNSSQLTQPSVTAFLQLVVMEGMYFLVRMPGVMRDWPSPAVINNLLIWCNRRHIYQRPQNQYHKCTSF